MRLLVFIFILIPQSFGTLLNVEVEEFTTTTKTNKDLVKELVTLTVYKPMEAETDSTPNLTASGFKIDVDNPGKHRIIAVSRDLKRKGWKFGKKVRIRKAGKYNGVYTIRDVMNKRYRNRIDILVDDEHKPTKLRNVEINLIN